MKILIWGEPKAGNSFDVFRQMDYLTVYRELDENFHASMINVGNKVWIQGIISCLSSDENQLSFLSGDQSWEEINASYDCIVYSAANMLAPYYKKLIEEVAALFRHSKIPVYVIAVGAQAPSFDNLPELADSIKHETAALMESIYATGGEIACRGFFTKELLDTIMPNTAVVTGCPSLYQNGPNLTIKPSGGKVHPVINGFLVRDQELFTEYPDCVGIDQDGWIPETYDYVHYKSKNSIVYLADLYRKHGSFFAEQFLKERIKVFYDAPDWRRFLIGKGFNFCIGSRIHGNIMALLSGIPAVVIAVDSRTREMADFYGIPCLLNRSIGALQDLYDNLDYSAFNRTYRKRYDAFEVFLKQRGLVKQMNAENIFWNRPAPLHAELISEQLHSAQGKYRFISRYGMLPLRGIAKLRKDKNPLQIKREPTEAYQIKEKRERG